MADKVRFGLSNCKYAIYNEADGTYGTPVAMPGAVSLSLTREGGDSSDYYADNGVYYTFAGTNGGYSADLEMARITPEQRAALLGEILDTTKKMYVEVTDPADIQFALICQYEGNQNPIAQVFYNCKAQRIETSANTLSDSPDVNSDTLNLRIAAQNFEFNGVTRGCVQAYIEKDDDNETQFSAFLTAVQKPTA